MRLKSLWALAAIALLMTAVTAAAWPQPGFVQTTTSGFLFGPGTDSFTVPKVSGQVSKVEFIHHFWADADLGLENVQDWRKPAGWTTYHEVDGYAQAKIDGDQVARVQIILAEDYASAQLGAYDLVTDYGGDSGDTYSFDDYKEDADRVTSSAICDKFEGTSGNVTIDVNLNGSIDVTYGSGGAASNAGEQMVFYTVKVYYR